MNHFYGGAPGLGFNHHTPYNRFGPQHHVSNISNNTNNNDPKSRESRVFVGNLNPEGVCQRKLEEIFSCHGTILAISLHKGYGFVQYGSKEEAQRAVKFEQGKVIAAQPMDLNIVAIANPNRPKGFKRVQNPAYYNSGYVDPATLPVIPAANVTTTGPPAAKKVRRFVEQSQIGKEGDEPSAWVCAYCKDTCTSCWALVKHVGIAHQTRIYMDDVEQSS